MLVAGESGMGKSALLGAFAAELDESHEAVVLGSRCHEREAMPYKAFDGVVDAVTRHLRRLRESQVASVLPRDIAALARVFPVLKRVDAVADARTRRALPADPAETKIRAFAALKELLSRIGDHAPLVLSIDDLQWGDVDSAKLLVELLGPPDPPAMLCIVAFRSDEARVSPCVQTLHESLATLAAGNVHELHVGPLAPEHGLALAEQLLSPELRVRAASLSTAAQGSPFFLTQLVEHHRVAGDADAGTTSLGQAILARVRALSEPARSTLEAVSVSGRPLAPALLAAASRLSADEVLHALGELCNERLARLLGSQPVRYETYHDRVRETVTASLDRAVQRGYHARLAQALEADQAADPRQLVDHLLGAGESGRAAVHAVEAARRAASALAFEQAAELYALALEHGSGGDRERNALQRARADALSNAGRSAEAGRLYLTCLPGADERDALVLKRKAAKHLLDSGHIDEGFALWIEVLRAHGVELPAAMDINWAEIMRVSQDVVASGYAFQERTEAECERAALERLDACFEAWLGMWMTDNESRHVALMTLLLRDSLALGEPRRVLRALCVSRSGAAMLDPSGRRAVGQERKLRNALVDSLALRFGDDPDLQGLVCYSRGLQHYWSGRYTDGLACFEQADAAWSSECVGATRQLVLNRTATLFVGFLGARIGARSSRYLADALARGDRFLAMVSRVMHAEVALRDGDLAAAFATIDAGARTWQGRALDVMKLIEWLVRVRCELYAGRTQEGVELVERTWRTMLASDMGRIGPGLFWCLQARVSVLLAAARRDAEPEPRLTRVEQALEHMRELAESARIANEETLAYEAAVYELRGARAQALDRLVQAEDRAFELRKADHGLALRLLRSALGSSAEDRALGRAAEADLRAAGVHDPLRWANHRFPGLVDVAPL